MKINTKAVITSLSGANLNDDTGTPITVGDTLANIIGASDGAGQKLKAYDLGIRIAKSAGDLTVTAEEIVLLREIIKNAAFKLVVVGYLLNMLDDAESVTPTPAK